MELLSFKNNLISFLLRSLNFLVNASVIDNLWLPRKNSQVISIGSDTRIYTPDQLNEIYEESVGRHNSSHVNNSILSKSKKVKRGVKSSYGNYIQSKNPHQFNISNNLKLSKGRKSIVTTGASKKSFGAYRGSSILDSFG